MAAFHPNIGSTVSGTCDSDLIGTSIPTDRPHLTCDACYTSVLQYLHGPTMGCLKGICMSTRRRLQSCLRKSSTESFVSSLLVDLPVVPSQAVVEDVAYPLAARLAVPRCHNAVPCLGVRCSGPCFAGYADCAGITKHCELKGIGE